MPGFTGTNSALAAKPMNAARAHAGFPRTLNRQYGGDGLRPGGSNRFSEGSHPRKAGRTGLHRRDLRNRSGRWDRGKSGIGSGQKSSGSGSTAQTPFGFTPFGARPGRDATGEGPASTPPR
jgi:hypothetical protein